MHTISKTFFVAGLALLTACGGEPKAPKNADGTTDVMAAKSPETAFIDLHISLMNKIADDMNSIQTEADARRLSGDISKNIKELVEAGKKYKGKIDEGKSASIMAFSGRQVQFMKAQRRMGKAQLRLYQEYPELGVALMKEMANMPELQ